MTHIWKEYECLFLKENYPKYGSTYCAKKLNIDKHKVKSKILRMKLHINDKTDITLFHNITTKEVSYILGLLWSDGNLNNIKSKYEVRIEANVDDMLEIENIIMKTGTNSIN